MSRCTITFGDPVVGIDALMSVLTSLKQEAQEHGGSVIIDLNESSDGILIYATVKAADTLKAIYADTLKAIYIVTGEIPEPVDFSISVNGETLHDKSD